MLHDHRPRCWYTTGSRLQSKSVKNTSLVPFPKLNPQITGMRAKNLGHSTKLELCPHSGDLREYNVYYITLCNWMYPISVGHTPFRQLLYPIPLIYVNIMCTILLFIIGWTPLRWLPYPIPTDKSL